MEKREGTFGAWRALGECCECKDSSFKIPGEGQTIFSLGRNSP